MDTGEKSAPVARFHRSINIDMKRLLPVGAADTQEQQGGAWGTVHLMRRLVAPTLCHQHGGQGNGMLLRMQ